MNPNRTDQPKLHKLPQHMQQIATNIGESLSATDESKLFSFIRDVYDYAWDAGNEEGYESGHRDGAQTGDLDGYNRGRQDAERRDG